MSGITMSFEEFVARMREIQEPYHVCSCGERHTRKQLSALEYRGIQDLGDGTSAEMRNCDACGSSRLSPGDTEAEAAE